MMRPRFGAQVNALRISVTTAISKKREAKSSISQSVVAGCEHG